MDLLNKIIIFFILYVVPLFFLGAISPIHLFLAYAVITICLLFLCLPNVLSFLGNVDYARGREDTAAGFFRMAILKDTKDPLVYLNYAAFLTKNGRYADALTHLKTAEMLNTKVASDKNIMLTVATCQWALGDIDSAITTLNHMRSKYDYIPPYALSTLGYLHFLKKDYPLATSYSIRAVEDDPALAQSWDNLGQIYFATSQFLRAKDAFKKALSLNPSLIDSNYCLGLIYEQKGDKLNAKKFFVKAGECLTGSLNITKKEDIANKLRKYDCI